MKVTRESLIAALRDPDVGHVLHAYSYTVEQQADTILAFLSRDSDPDEWMDGSGERVIDLVTGQYADEGASE